MNNRWCHCLALVWLVVIIALGSYSAKKIYIDGSIQFDLLALLPQGKTENMLRSNEFMEDSNISGRILIAFGHEQADKAKQALLQFRTELQGATLPLHEHSVRQIEANYKALFSGLYPYRAGLVSKEDRQDLLNNLDEALVKRALANIFSPFGSFDANQIKTDPFGFFPRFATSFHSNTTLKTDAEGNITAESGGKNWYVYQGEVTEKIFSLKLQEKITQFLLPILDHVEKDSGVEVLRVGGVFYSTSGAQQAQFEISTLSVISAIGILLILLLIFRTPHPILLAITVVSSGLLVGLAVCLFVFGSIHILALVFGCSLVGVAVDYALHYYCASFKSISRFYILQTLFPALPLGILTSSLGYGALIIAPFPGIQQMAVIACVGLVSTFISVSVWGPYFIKTGERKTPLLAEKIQNYVERLASMGSIKNLKPAVSFILLSVFCTGALMLTFDDNVRNFQSLDPQLKSQEERIKSMLNFNHSTNFLAVTGHDMETILQTEEEIIQTLDTIEMPYRSLSELIPSQKRQQEIAAAKLRFSQANFPTIAEILGLEPPSIFEKQEAGFDGKVLLPENEFIHSLPPGWRELAHIADNGSITGRIILEAPLQTNTSINHPNATYIDPVREYSLLFESYREVMLRLVGSLLLGFALFLSLYRGFKASIAITTPVLFSMLATVGIIGLFGIGFSMFHAMGLVLVLCIGIDYALFLYWRKPEEKELLMLGNTLAAITTILSFGLLALSKTTAVNSFGMTVFIGIVLNFFITTLFLGNTKCRNFF